MVTPPKGWYFEGFGSHWDGLYLDELQIGLQFNSKVQLFLQVYYKTEPWFYHL
jgi:hypothetical protein